MMKTAKQILYKIRDVALEHEISMRIFLLLKKTGVPRKLNYWMTCAENRSLREHPSDDMLRSQKFYKENSERVKHINDLLADEMSKNTWGGVLAYRTMRAPISPELCQLNNTYFVDDVIQVENGEVFIDAGAYIGDTIKPLLKCAGERHVEIKRIVAFEPGETNYKLLTRYYGQNPAVILIKKGVSDRNGVSPFSGIGETGKITEGDIEQDGAAIPVVRIDDVSECSEATWIKMDIEGAEMQALAGARETILRNHPKLTICIYHSDEDMLRIPEYIHELVPEYKLYIRHHMWNQSDTVLYAIP